MKKNLVRIAAGVATLLVVAYFIIGYVVYDKLSKVEPGGGENAGNTPASFQNTIDEWPDFDVSLYLMGGFEAVRIPSRQEGLELAGWYIPGDPDAPVVILTHGFGSCKCSPRILTAAGMLNQNGFAVFMYDMREHGESDIEDGRAAVGTEEYLDLLGAWDWLIHGKGYTPDRIGVYGQSLGAGTTLIAFGQEPQMAAAFVDSPFSDLRVIIMEELVRNDYPTFLVPGALFMAQVVAGDNLTSFGPQEALTNDAGRPIFIVHGTGDTRIDIHHTRDLAALGEEAGANLTVWIPDGVGHVEAEFAYPEEYEQSLVDFFSTALGK
ncbi:MAG TPA: alpha/beta fold hydrolase [Anaerolineales bacterium]|nr:alpha/beta fold hydrolase [Anaerolineales bacterium]